MTPEGVNEGKGEGRREGKRESRKVGEYGQGRKRESDGGKNKL